MSDTPERSVPVPATADGNGTDFPLEAQVSPLAERVLAILGKDPEKWSHADCTLLLSLYPIEGRNAMAHALWMHWHFFGKNGGKTELRWRLQLAAGIRWDTLLNPPVRRSWWHSIRFGRFAAAGAREVSHLLDRQKGRGDS